ncbi:MAG: hypothetical protein JXB36_02970 [Gammaproteobacteria bacterium]|nr:hypothetical protein [Gammaproteobacteria bacterium]
MSKEANDEAVRRLKLATDNALDAVLKALAYAGRPARDTIGAIRTAISMACAEAMDAGISFERDRQKPPAPPDTDITSTRPGFPRRRSSRPPAR